MDYHLLLKFGEEIVPLTPSNLKELTIVQDINKFLPEFRLRVVDVSGALAHLLPFNKDMSKVYIEVAASPQAKQKNSFTFAIFNRRPVGDQSNPSTMYDISGLLDVPGMFSPDYCRAHSSNINSTLESIAASELGVDSSEVSSSLSYKKTLLQPRWSDIQFLKWAKENLIGSSSEYGYKCFVKRQNMKSVFIFKSLPELISQPVSYSFIVDSKGRQDHFPVFNYEMFDYYKMYGIFASKKQRYSYFDYDTSEFMSSEESAQDYLSLAKYWLIDKDDEEGSNTLTELGRSNEFTSDFSGKVKSSFSNRLMNLAKMWVTTIGLPNVTPGMVVKVFFPQGISSGNLGSYQYSGYWLVERVAHNIGDAFMTKLLLTRNGLDTDKNTSLLKSEKTRTNV